MTAAGETIPQSLPGSLPADFTARLASAPQRLLMLDYDGTLAPFHEERGQAMPYPGVRGALLRILPDIKTRVTIISGRAIDDLLPLLDLDPSPEIWGSHGWEHLSADGLRQVRPLPERCGRALEEARAVAREHAFADRCEDKPVGLAAHWRGLTTEDRDALAASVRLHWSPLAESGDLDLHEFDGGVELRAPGWDKGRVVETILAQVDPDAAAAYLGDDRTDEDAFDALSGRGLSVLVRPEIRPTRADFWLRPPEELLAFLHAWAQVSEAV
jgi:trehalose-phosphatase